MPISRLRLQLAAWFALAFVVGLGAADAALFALLRRGADQELADRVRRAAAGFAQAVRREQPEVPGGLGAVAREAYAEWPADSNGFVVYDASGQRVFAAGDGRLAELVPPAAQLPAGSRTWDIPLDDDGALRLAQVRVDSTPAFRVVAFQPTAGIVDAQQQLAWWLALSAPLVVLLALVGGYFLARRALAPLSRMSRAIQEIAPQDLDRRLPVRQPPDELDLLAERFNGLLGRLAAAAERNRRFLGRVAHQLRTPLTVIRGESTLGLERPRSTEEYRALLKRVALAGEQMSHRVDDLFLLAQAEAGDRPPLGDRIELDGTVLECTDLMRGRAAELGCRLELGDIDAAELVGNEALVREAILELLENACRHGDPAAPIRIATRAREAVVAVEVTGGGPAIDAALLQDGDGDRRAERGLGLSIVRWIAGVHGGRLSCRRDAALNTFVLEFAAAVHLREEPC